MKIVVIGTGYVGLVTGISLSLLGHSVQCVGRNKEKIDAINHGIAPFYEPGLEELLKRVLSKKLFCATNDIETSVKNAHVVIIAVGTPTVDGQIDLSSLKIAARQIGEALRGESSYQVIVVKSTVIPTTTEKVVKPIVEKYSSRNSKTLGFCMNPEFLREGCAVSDATSPDRIVIGQYDERSGKEYGKVYASVKAIKIYTTLRTAEMTKYAANALFATLISYSNEVARICEALGEIDVVDVWKGVHLDGRLTPTVANKRITPGIVSFIFSGCGYGGSCFPKDTKAFYNYGKTLGISTPIIKGVIETNKTQPERMIPLLKQAIGSIRNKKIAILGLAFKPQTDDIRESPAIPIIQKLLLLGAKVICHDPEAYAKTIPAALADLPVQLVQSPQEAIKGSDAVVVVTSWAQYKNITGLDYKKLMKKPVVIDGRRIYNRDLFRAAGVLYKGIGLSG